MPDPSPARSAAPREAVEVTCASCGVSTTVPFTPTPGRPVYCRACFSKRSGPGSPAGGGPSRGPPRTEFRSEAPRGSTTRRRMLSQGRKAHFVYDVLEILGRENRMAGEVRRTFVEMLFTRGARQSTDAAIEYIASKVDDKTLTTAEGQQLSRLVDRYSFWR
ncbi:MAG TPA: CxxC-x17-CxxC domain-containing protein [Candidatus Thermoplasmatota archaeon]|nr:CxxC-x17-CxxC domain-containing protein [Candidatus Thermoplasmatota archaeon]